MATPPFALDHVQLAMPPGGEGAARAFCRDLDAVVRRLEAGGFTPTWDDALPGVRRCYVRDPFGNRIELLGPGGLGARGGAPGM